MLHNIAPSRFFHALGHGGLLAGLHMHCHFNSLRECNAVDVFARRSGGGAYTTLTILHNHTG